MAIHKQIAFNFSYVYSLVIYFQLKQEEHKHDKTSKMHLAPNHDTNHPGYLPSLFNLFLRLIGS